MIKVHLSGVKLLTDCTAKEKAAIKEELTFDNPQYKSAQRHSRYGTGSIPPYLNYYQEGNGILIVPRGYVIPFPYRIVKDDRVLNRHVKYPKLHIKLRGTQVEAVDAFMRKVIREREESGVIILPTGKGKSILGLYLARKYSQRVLVIVQKDDLVSGWTADAKVIFGMRPKEVGLIKAQEYRIGKQVTVTTIQTLSKLPPEKIMELHKIFGMVIVDEFHHSAASIYKLVDYFPARFKIGLTATAMRNDGLVGVLNLYFGKVAYEFQDTGNDADILPVTVRIRNAPTEFEPEREMYYHKGKNAMIPENIPIGVVRKATSFDEGFNTMLAKDIIGEYKRGKSCVVFTHEKEHCRIIEERLIERGIPAEHIQLYYGDATESKESMKLKAENKTVYVTIATYAIATEGTNVKAWERAFLASTVANEKDTVQAIGRIRRTMTGKKDCVVYDYRFPGVILAKSHGKIRDKVYKERGYAVIGREIQNRKPTGRPVGRGWTGRR